MSPDCECTYCNDDRISALRDDFAGMALSAFLPSYLMQQIQMKMNLNHREGEQPVTITFGETNYEEVATESYLMADAMVRARSRTVKVEREETA